MDQQSEAGVISADSRRPYQCLQRGEGTVLAKDYTIAYLFDLYGAALTDKQRALVEYYYNDDLSLSEISENEGITRQGARDGIKRAESQLKEWEEKLGLMEKSRERSAKTQGIREAAAAALAGLDREDGIAAAKERLREILAAAETLLEELPAGSAS